MHQHDTSIMNFSAMSAFQLKEQTFCIILNLNTFMFCLFETEIACSEELSFPKNV